jgi:biopolymer transport protein ExbB/TolQ
MAKMLTGQNSFTLSALSMRSLLEGIHSRLDETRDLSRYLIGLLIFLGLLGTFWGLLETLGSVGNVIDGLAVRSNADIGVIFNDLKSGLKEPLTGMGVAFSSSLFGLAGSLILGFLDLQAGHAQTRFSNSLEEWLSELTRLSSLNLTGEGEPHWPDYLQALLEQTAENLDKFQRQLVRSESERIDTNVNLVILAERIEHLTKQLHEGQKVLVTLAENNLLGTEQSIPDYMHGLDSNLKQVREMLAGNQNRAVDELRSEVRLLARTISKHAFEPSRANGKDKHGDHPSGLKGREKTNGVGLR